VFIEPVTVSIPSLSMPPLNGAVFFSMVQHIRGLDVAVDQALLMGMLNSLADRYEQLEPSICRIDNLSPQPEWQARMKSLEWHRTCPPLPGWFSGSGTTLAASVLKGVQLYRRARFRYARNTGAGSWAPGWRASPQRPADAIERLLGPEGSARFISRL
jgi:hypothetical protein